MHVMRSEVARSRSGPAAGRSDHASPDTQSAVTTQPGAGDLWSKMAYALPDSGGRPLDQDTRAAMEPALGAELSGVRIHTDAAAAAAAQRLDAWAFTLGQDIYSGAGHLREDTKWGRRLLAHELAHVVQNRTDPSDGPLRAPVHGGPGGPAGSAEVEAQRTAQRVMDPDLEGRQEEASATSAPDEERAELIQQASWRASGAMPVSLSATEPTNLVVPADGT
jgi:hypothetical protein